MHSMIVYFSVIGIVFIPICIAAGLRKMYFRFRAPKQPRRRYITVPTKDWCKKHVDQWKN